LIGRIWSIIDRTQQSRLFKIIASCVVVALAIGMLITYSVGNAKAREAAIADFRTQFGDAAVDRALAAEQRLREESSSSQPGPQGNQGENQDSKDAKGDAEIIDQSTAMMRSLLGAQFDTKSVAMGIAVGALVCLAVIWVNLSLTYLLLAVGCAAILGIAHLFGAARTVGPFVIGLFTLTGSFTAILRLLMALLSWSHPVISIARNVLQEAVRMKISLIFIIAMIFGLAVLPTLLSEDQPLRYRIQSFLQYGTSGAFGLIAILVVLFSVMTVAAEQRDKQIWQTITKPVAPWQYILGKWLGVAVLSAALLAVASSGIFVFTEYLRNQRAQGEATAFRASAGAVLSEDRAIVENQILTSRRTINPDPPPWDPNELGRELDRRIETELAALGVNADNPEELARNKAAISKKIEEELLKSLSMAYRTIMPGDNRVYFFSGLKEAKKTNRPLFFRYSIQSGANMPDELYKVSIAFPGLQAATVRETYLSQFQTIEISPAVINDEGMVIMQIFNGDVFTQQANPKPFTFPSDGIRLSFSTSSYQANYLRLMFVYWIKLLFLAMVGICAATFLSFPVAALLSFVVFWAAEGARALATALETYETTTLQGQTLWFNVVIEKLAIGISAAFSVYSDLRPTARLVEGEHLSWGSLASGTIVVGIWCLVLFAVGVLIFRRRELAIYSGQ
jgi:ABC-type transport system involved in multi-copper enzyme maturation permease subunit